MTVLYAALDLGGTRLRGLIADPDGNVRGEDIRPSETARGLEGVLATMIDCARAAANAAGVRLEDVEALGISPPGAINTATGVVSAAPQLPGWRDVPLVQIMSGRLGVTVFLENDASAAALGEQRFGAGRGARQMLYMTISTGIGGGIIIDGKLYTGATGAAGELGHVVVKADGPACGCGGRGCLEAFSSGTAIARRAKEVAAAGESQALAGLEEQGRALTADVAADAARSGDDASRRIFEEVGYYLGVALAGYVNIFNPELVLLGGGVMHAADLFLELAERTMRERAMSEPLKHVRLDRASLGERSGSLGMIARMADAAAR